MKKYFSFYFILLCLGSALGQTFKSSYTSITKYSLDVTSPLEENIFDNLDTVNLHLNSKIVIIAEIIAYNDSHYGYFIVKNRKTNLEKTAPSEVEEFLIDYEKHILYSKNSKMYFECEESKIIFDSDTLSTNYSGILIAENKKITLRFDKSIPAYVTCKAVLSNNKHGVSSIQSNSQFIKLNSISETNYNLKRLSKKFRRICKSKGKTLNLLAI